MLPIALTCPVWWVARWTARMFASLAVVVACSFGAATLPAGVAAAAPAPAVAASAYPVAGASTAARPEADRVAERHAGPAGAPAPAPRVAVPAVAEPVPAGWAAAPAGPRAPPIR
ncbi:MULTISPECIES: hypothetical protein [unclassified Micromonospora]|uniref:hypothetical protein n=1 Tax=unclassified Micromonospora TaxID=2617518 RepID=UPI001C216780|nr:MULTISPECIES: hypothetical protein [unclassified Micromonospora]MBU8859880.1 hypothetical protein [Micromonospora sp. WMMB482]MDM4779404.1 hypothetical protein [Micromonospora sp. b486]